MRIAIFLGSGTDFPILSDAFELLKRFEVPFFVEVTSAHRSPERTLKLIRKAEEEGVEIFIAVAGKAAHLAGFIAGQTLLPVIGVPVESPGFFGLDALLSTVQMPKGVPVATLGLGKSGAANAVILALEILSLKYPEYRQKLEAYRNKLARQVEEDSEEVKKKL